MDLAYLEELRSYLDEELAEYADEQGTAADRVLRAVGSGELPLPRCCSVEDVARWAAALFDRQEETLLGLDDLDPLWEDDGCWGVLRASRLDSPAARSRRSPVR